MIHHFFEHHAFGETKVHLHTDNCTGQNKNPALCGGKAQPGGGGLNVLFDVNKAASLALWTLHTSLYSDRSLATAVRCSSAALIA